MADYSAAYGNRSYSTSSTKASKKDQKDAFEQYGIDPSQYGGKRRKSRRKSKSRKKRGASVLGDVWEYGFVNPVSNLVIKPTEYAVGSVIPGQVGNELRARGSTHREPGMYGKKGSFFGGKRRKSRRKKRRKSRKSRKKRRRSRKRRR